MRFCTIAPFWLRKIGCRWWSGCGLLSRLLNNPGRHVFRNGTVTPAEMTLEEVIKRGQRAIVTFQKNDYLRKKFLPGVQHLWADTDNVTELRVSSRRANRTTFVGPMHSVAKSLLCKSGLHEYDSHVVLDGSGILTQR